MAVWLIALVGAAVSLLAFMMFMSRKYSFWKKRGVPYVPPIPLIGSFPLKGFGNNKHVHEMDLENEKKYGKIYGFYEGLSPTLMVSVPEFVRDITIKDFHLFSNRRQLPIMDELMANMISLLKGEEWKRVRAKMSPAFSSGKMRKMVPLIKECAETACKNFQEISETKKPYDVKKIFGAFTMDVIATTAFGTKLDSHNDPENLFVRHARKVFNQDFTICKILLFVFPRLFQMLGESFIDKEAMHFFMEITEKLIKERKENPDIKRYDFLQMMLDEMHDGLPNGKDAGEQELKEGLSKIEIIANAILFFIAGYETTASTLAHCAYLLALNPECQERLQAEMDRTLSDPNVSIDYDSVKTMPYLDAVITETLRILPPASRTDRLALQNYALGDTGIVVPKGTLVQVPIHTIHHNPEYYPEPEKFDPERFLPENRDNIRPFTYLPFGAGPRNCIAERFARLEMKLCLARVIHSFRFQLVPETKVPLEFIFNQGFLVGHDVTLLVEKRT